MRCFFDIFRPRALPPRLRTSATSIHWWVYRLACVQERLCAASRGGVLVILRSRLQRAERVSRTAMGHACHALGDDHDPKRSPTCRSWKLERAKGFEPSTPTLARLVQAYFRCLPQIDVR